MPTNIRFFIGKTSVPNLKNGEKRQKVYISHYFRIKIHHFTILKGEKCLYDISENM